MALFQWEHQGKRWIYDADKDLMAVNPDQIRTGKFEADTFPEAKRMTTNIVKEHDEDGPDKWKPATWYPLADGSFMKTAYSGRTNYDREQIHLKIIKGAFSVAHLESSVKCLSNGRDYYYDGFPNTAIAYLERALELDNWIKPFSGTDPKLSARYILASCYRATCNPDKAFALYHKTISEICGIPKDWKPSKCHTADFFQRSLDAGKCSFKETELAIRFKLGICYERTGNADGQVKALDTYRNALDRYDTRL